MDTTSRQQHATPEQLLSRLEELGLSVVTHDHPAVFTVEEAKQHCAHIEGGHCKTLFVKTKKGQMWLISALESTTIDLKALSQSLAERGLIQGRLSFASAERLMEILGVMPGSVTPFALINDGTQKVGVILDSRLMAYEKLNFHPLTNDKTTTITTTDLNTFIRSCGHEPLVLDFAGIGEIASA